MDCALRDHALMNATGEESPGSLIVNAERRLSGGRSSHCAGCGTLWGYAFPCQSSSVHRLTCASSTQDATRRGCGVHVLATRACTRACTCACTCMYAGLCLVFRRKGSRSTMLMRRSLLGLLGRTLIGRILAATQLLTADAPSLHSEQWQPRLFRTHTHTAVVTSVFRGPSA